MILQDTIQTGVVGASASVNPVFYSPQVQVGKSALQHMDLFGLKPRPARPFIIGICGGSSSGKSTVANLIKTKLKNQPHIINLIDFYLPLRGNMRRKSSLPTESEGDVAVIEKEITEIDKHYDFDVPQAIDWELLIKGLQLLRESKPFNKPIYDEHLKLRKEETEKVMPTDIIILEGHLIFCNQQVMDLLDLKVFIDTDDDVRLSRRVLKMSNKCTDKKNELTQLQDLLYKYEK